MAYLYVALGSAFGGVARYAFGLLASRLWGDSFPWGTIAINITGSFIIGFFGALTAPDGPLPANPNLRIFVMVGICGGFTTFSSFSLQTLSLARDGSWLPAMGNVLLSVTLCLLAVTAGHFAASRISLSQLEESAVSRSILAILDRPETAPAVLAAAALVADRLGDAQIEALHVRHETREGFLPTEDVVTGDRRQEIEGEAARRSAALRGIFDAWRWDGIRTWCEIAGDTARIIAEDSRDSRYGCHRDPAGGPPCGGEPGGSCGLVRCPANHPADAARRSGFARPARGDRLEAGRCRQPGGRGGASVSVAGRTCHRADLRRTMAGRPDDPPGTLQTAGIAADIVRFQADGRSTGEALTARAHAVGADMLVMGAFTHGRMAEAILGGTTRAFSRQPIFPC